jgi:hypothetical protein
VLAESELQEPQKVGQFGHDVERVRSMPAKSFNVDGFRGFLASQQLFFFGSHFEPKIRYQWGDHISVLLECWTAGAMHRVMGNQVSERDVGLYKRAALI